MANSAEALLTELLKNNKAFNDDLQPRYKEWIENMANLYKEQGEGVMPILKETALMHALDDFRDNLIKQLIKGAADKMKETLLGLLASEKAPSETNVDQTEQKREAE